PDLLQAHYNLALCEIEQKNFPAAIASLRDALRCQPLSALAHAKLGELLLEEKQYKESLFHLQQAVDLNPENSEHKKKLDEARHLSIPSPPRPRCVYTATLAKIFRIRKFSSLTSPPQLPFHFWSIHVVFVHFFDHASATLAYRGHRFHRLRV